MSIAGEEKNLRPADHPHSYRSTRDKCFRIVFNAAIEIGFYFPDAIFVGPCRGASTGFMIASGGVLSEGYGHGGPGVCLGDGQMEAEGVPSQGGRGDALLRRMPPYLT